MNRVFSPMRTIRILPVVMLFAACGHDAITAPDTAAPWRTLRGEVPLVIGHRGASAHLPGHTLEAYELAIDQGADFIEPDLVLTKDNVLICRHDRFLSATTNVADHPEFTDRRVEKDGRSDWWAEDFTLAEIKTLRSREPYPHRSKLNDDKFGIPEFSQVVELAKRKSEETGRIIGIYPEPKEAEFFAANGRDIVAALVTALEDADWTGADAPVIVQSFEASVLQALNQQIDVPLIQLTLSKTYFDPDAADESFIELDSIPAYADGVGPDRRLIVHDDGTITNLIERAHALGLKVHVWTMYGDQDSPDGLSPEDDTRRFYDLGVDGLFADDPGQAVRVRAEHYQDLSPSDDYGVQIRWTSYGIPHVKANDFASLGYGFAYATATDAFCVIARDIVMVNGNLSLYFGADQGNYESDVFHRAMLTEARLQRFALAMPDVNGVYNQGYVDGYNRYLKDNASNLPASCSGEPWVRPMVAEDVARLLTGVGIRYGLGRFKNDIARAQPPSEQVAAGDSQFGLEAGIGSNAVAFGKAVTESGRGILLGNPHYPWRGSSRFHLIHTTIPGVVDTMGVSLYTTNAVSIGFNKDVAWTHTVSTALRFTLYELSLNPENPLEYRYGDEFRAIEEQDIDVDVRKSDGSNASQRHKVYMTHYGPIIVSDQLPWDHEKAYAIRDAVIDNTAGAATYAALGVATSVDDIEAAISQQGVFWTNTIAADKHGTAFYADISTTPNVDRELLDTCRVGVASVPAFIVVLDGSKPECEWQDDSRSHVAGTLPAEAMPRLRRDDYVTNSNDSYWLSNPDAPLEGYSPIIGPERSARTLRTRAGLTFVAEQLATGDKVSADDLRAILYSQRNFGAELLLDDILDVCHDNTIVALADGREADIAASCEVLAAWDRSANVDSRGMHVWTEFWRSARNIENLYAVPFDADDPVNTPRGIAVNNPAVRTVVRQALAAGQLLLQDAGIALDTRWGELQYASRNGKNIAIPGAQGWAGMFSMIVANLDKDRGYTPILHGNSYIQVVSWDESGKLKPSGILTYSQSQEPESEHYYDLTELYSRGEWIDFPFTEEEIAADSNLRTLRLNEAH